MKQNKYLLYLIILVWPFGLLLRGEFGFLAKPVYLLDILVGLVFVVSNFDKKFRIEAKKDSLFKPLSIFILALTVSLLANLNRLSSLELTVSLQYLLRVIVYPVLYFVAKNNKSRDLQLLSFISALLFIAFGLLQYFLLPDLRFLKNLGFDDHLYRLAGTFADPNFAGAILASLSLVFLSLNQYLLLLVSLLSLALTFSRASYLAFVVGLILYVILNKKYKALAIMGFLSVAIFLSPKPFGEGVNLLRTVSIFSRLENVKEGIILFQQKPVFGWGYNTLNASLSNSFVFILATSGVVGFVAFLNLLKSVYLNSSNTSKVILVALLTHSLFNNTFFFIYALSFFWITLALMEYKKPL